MLNVNTHGCQLSPSIMHSSPTKQPEDNPTAGLVTKPPCHRIQSDPSLPSTAARPLLLHFEPLLVHLYWPPFYAPGLLITRDTAKASMLSSRERGAVRWGTKRTSPSPAPRGTATKTPRAQYGNMIGRLGESPETRSNSPGERRDRRVPGLMVQSGTGAPMRPSVPCKYRSCMGNCMWLQGRVWLHLPNHLRVSVAILILPSPM